MSQSNPILFGARFVTKLIAYRITGAIDLVSTGREATSGCVIVYSTHPTGYPELWVYLGD